MRRRAFIGLLGGAALAWPLTARAQQPGKYRTIGFLGAATPSAASQWVAALVERLRELGWIEGRTVAIEYRWAEGRNERLAEIAAEFVRLNVDVIVTWGTASVLAAKQATSVIPIVFASAGDPVGTALVASLARPGGNVTGSSNQAADIAGKRLELSREFIPGLRHLAILANISSPIGVLQMGEAQALYVVSEALVLTHRTRIHTLATAARLPTMHDYREYVEAGGLMSYGPNFPASFRRAADFVDKILRGASPADLPIEQPTKFDLVINLTTARALGLTVPDALLARADEVIE
jgi:putative ABC transport system substrate-binding protein